MKYKDGVILTSDYPYMEPDGHASIYDFIDGKIVFRKEIKLKNTKAHGCEIVDSQTVIITSNSDHNRGILFLDIETGAIKQNLNNLKYYPKDVCIIGDYLFNYDDNIKKIQKLIIIKFLMIMIL
jgi:nitrous oxidase accessory protein NosD